jgi:hypothetical protein
MSVKLDITSETLCSLGFRELHAGDDYPMQFTAKQGGVVIPLDKVWLTVKRRSIETDAQALLQLTEISGITITGDGSTGVFTVNFAAANTANLEGLHKYDIQVKVTSSGDIITVARGDIEFLENITRATS